MKIKVLKSKKTKFPSYYTFVNIVVVGEEEKGTQKKSLQVYFSEVADKKLPVGFKGGVIECDAKDVNAPYVYEIKPNKDDRTKKDYPFVYIKDLKSVTALQLRENTCTFITDEKETEEVSFDEKANEELDSYVLPDDLPDDDLPF